MVMYGFTAKRMKPRLLEVFDSSPNRPKVQKALGDMGVMEYAKIDVEKLIGNDMKVAEDFDAKKFVNAQIAAE